MEVTRESIILDKKIGSGQYSDVWQGKLKDKLDVAVKTLKPGRMEGSEFLIEAKILLILRHANILKLLAVCTKTEPFYIVTELMKNGSLLDYLRDDYRRKEFTFSNIIFIISQIASGMTHFERSNYIHRDLAARNILVGERNIVKIGDLTTAKEADSGEDGKRFYLGREGEKLPVKWTAPECYLSKCWKTSSDVWSFGIVLYEIITFGSIPYPGMTNREVVTSVPEGYRMTKPAMQMMKDHDSTILFNIAMSCWKESPEKRPTFEYLKEFFYNYKQS